MTTLRPYQSDAICDYHAATNRGQRRIILVCPTGGGKTVICASIIDSLMHSDINRSVLVLAHRREIISLTSRKLHAAGVPHGIIQAGFPTRPDERVQVASIQTLWSRMRTDRWICRQPICSSSMNATMVRQIPTARSSRLIPTPSCSG